MKAVEKKTNVCSNVNDDARSNSRHGYPITTRCILRSIIYIYTKEYIEGFRQFGGVKSGAG